MFGRVKSLESSLENLSGKIEERINNTLDSQQQVNEQISQFADSQELSQDISWLREKFKKASQNVESNYSNLHNRVSRLSNMLEELEKEKLNVDVDLDSLFGRIKSLENSVNKLQRKINNILNSQYQPNQSIEQYYITPKGQIEEINNRLVEAKNNVNIPEKWNDFLDISIVYYLIAIVLLLININQNIFLTLLCLILASPFLLVSLVVFLWSYASIFLIFGKLFYCRPNLVLREVNYCLDRHPLIYFKHPLISRFWWSIISFITLFQGIRLLGEFYNCSQAEECLNEQSTLTFVIIIVFFLPAITVLWFVIDWIILQFIKAMALLKQKFLERLRSEGKKN